MLESLGLKNLQLAPMHRLEDGIKAVRVFLPATAYGSRADTIIVNTPLRRIGLH